MERFRGSSELPLTDAGVRGAADLGMQIAKKGGLDELMASSLGRTVHTAKIISHYTHAPITHVGDELHPWHLGALEGHEVTDEKNDYVHHLITQEPDTPLPGRGPISTRDGESFNDFKNRSLPFLTNLVHQVALHPDKKIGLVTHYRVRKLLGAWMKNGAQDDLSINSEDMANHDQSAAPGSIERLHVDPYAGPQMTAIDLKSPTPLRGGLYFIRHEATPWNKPDDGVQS